MPFNQEEPIALIDKNTTLFWFRRDLRLQDNTGLYHALKENEQVLPLFIFDTTILNKLEDIADSRVEFIHQSIAQLKHQLEKAGSSLLVLHGDPVKLFKNILPKAVYANNDYEPYARQRDEKVAALLHKKGIPFKSYKDQVIFEKSEICKDNHEPYTIYTPYSKKWKATLAGVIPKKYLIEKYTGRLKKVLSLTLPALEKIGFIKTAIEFPKRVIKQSAIEHYHSHRDFPAIDGTTRLSIHLRFGTVSIRELIQVAVSKNEVWLNELIWREFYQMILWHFPHVETKSFKPAYDRIVWRNDSTEFNAWCNGLTGYPLVDAGMRELNATGFMHNRVRMVTASFLTKHLLIDWRWGEAYFAKKLLDYDMAANNGGWQWAAGSGCDAAPYFRIFNPALQAKRFDPENVYIKKWIPEINRGHYPAPIVDHKFARERVLKMYKTALEQFTI